MGEFTNPYTETREKSPGELVQEYASLFKMASLFFGLSFTEREQEAIPVVIGAVMRESKKVDIVEVMKTLQRFIPANPK